MNLNIWKDQFAAVRERLDVLGASLEPLAKAAMSSSKAQKVAAQMDERLKGLRESAAWLPDAEKFLAKIKKLETGWRASLTELADQEASLRAAKGRIGEMDRKVQELVPLLAALAELPQLEVDFNDAAGNLSLDIAWLSDVDRELDDAFFKDLAARMANPEVAAKLKQVAATW